MIPSKKYDQDDDDNIDAYAWLKSLSSVYLLKKKREKVEQREDWVTWRIQKGPYFLILRFISSLSPLLTRATTVSSATTTLSFTPRN